MQCYIVGGAVRDLLMGQNPKDADMAFSGSPEDFMQAFPTAQKVGKTVQVWMVGKYEYMPLYHNDITQDLTQRDLTINALALDEHGILYAHPLAIFDIKNTLLRPASNKAFFTDPTRIYRLARFAALYPHFSVHKDSIAQGRAVVQEAKHTQLPGERVGRECIKALHAEKPSRFFQVLAQTQALLPWFTEYAQLPLAKQKLFEQLTDTFPWQTDTEEDPHTLSLIRWMFLGYCMGNDLDQSLQEHAIYRLGHRLCLPLTLTKAGYAMAQTFVKACQFSQLCVKEKVRIVRKIEALGISLPYWRAVDHICQKSISVQALQALCIVKGVHLPPQWQNKGALSGEKHFALQCQALQNEILQPIIQE